MPISETEGAHRNEARAAILQAIAEAAADASPAMLRDLSEAYANVVSPGRGTLSIDTRG